MTGVESILLTRLDGLGDIVLGSSLLAGLRRRWPGASITMVVRPQFAGIGAILPGWLRVIALPFDPREPVPGREDEIVRGLRTTAHKCTAQMCVIAEHNRVWAGEILSVLSGAGTVVSFDGPCGLNVMHRRLQQMLSIDVDPSGWTRVPVDADCRELDKYRAMFCVLGGDELPLPELVVSEEARERSRGVWRQLELPFDRTVVFFPSSGDLLDKSLDAERWAAWIRHVVHENHREVLLLGAATDAPVLERISASGLPQQAKCFLVPAGDFGLLAGLLFAAEAYIGADTGPMHVAAVLGRPTLGVFGGGHRAERFLPVGPRAAALRMPMGCYGCGWLCPFETKLCVKEIPLDALLAASDELLAGAGEHEPDRPHIIDLPPPTGIDQRLARAAMRLHRAWLDLNHVVIEHHDGLGQRLAALSETIAHLDNCAAQMTVQNQRRDEGVGHLSHTLSEMTRQNERRDEAISLLSDTLAEMTRQNQKRDEAIARLSEVLAEMTRQNQDRDRSIAELAEQSHHHRQALAEMTEAAARRDRAIADLAEALAEMTDQNRRRDEAIATVAAQTGEQVAAVEQTRREMADLRRRAVRVPRRIYDLCRRLLGRAPSA